MSAPVGLFVYGTLREGGRLASLLPTWCERQPARLHGRLYEVGGVDYPGLLAPSQPTDLVVGDLLVGIGPEDVPAITRMEEGAGFVTGVGMLEDGRRAWCWWYGRTNPRRRITSGDWLNPFYGKPPAGPGSHGGPQARLRERNRAIAERWLHGSEAYERIGADHGMSRENVRLIVVAQLGRAVMRLRRRRDEARKRCEQRRDHPPLRCAVCGGPVTGRYPDAKVRLCHEHTAHARAIRYLIDSERHQLQQAAIARNRGLPEPKPTSDGPWENRARRWVGVGSTNDRLIREAIEHGWPLLDRLPADVRAQYGLR